jgi:hypothetical protein
LILLLFFLVICLNNPPFFEYLELFALISVSFAVD